MFRLTHRIQPYAWGSRRFIAELLGAQSPSAEPQAELWLGTHERAPSMVNDTSLRELIAGAPQRMLGASVADAFDEELPFLLKVLAADAPLSLQMHPTADQAREGFDEEEARGVPRDDQARSFRDPRAKPELIVALEPFDALCGFRSDANLQSEVAAFAIPVLQSIAASLLHGDHRAALAAWLALDRPAAIVAQVAGACTGKTDAASQWLIDLATRYPSDPTALAPLFLELVQLAPGEALFLGAGVLHAYLRGAGIEIMACSDNVIRAGLTEKHVDRATLLKVMREDTPVPARVEPIWLAGGHAVFDPGVPAFRLHRLDLRGENTRIETVGPAVILCTNDELMARTVEGTEMISRGSSVFVAAHEAPVEISGRGQAFVATVGKLSNTSAERQAN